MLRENIASGGERIFQKSTFRLLFSMPGEITWKAAIRHRYICSDIRLRDHYEVRTFLLRGYERLVR